MDEPTRAQTLVAEVIGTAFLVFIGAGSVPATLILNGKEPFTMADLGVISLAFATVIVAAVYALGHISGCHINPAVTLGLAATGKFPWAKVPEYLAAQVVGAVVGAVAILAVLGSQAADVGLGIGSYGDSTPMMRAFAAEAIGTFMLVFTVFGVIHRKAVPGWAGLAIALVVFAVIIPVGPVSGAAINPAREVGPMIVNAFAGGPVKWGQLPVYWVAQFLGGLLGAFAYQWVSHTRADALVAADARTVDA